LKIVAEGDTEGGNSAGIERRLTRNTADAVGPK
jgi:hypothetical protein